MLQPVEIVGLGFITRTILVSAHIDAFSNQNQDNNNNNNNKDDIFGLHNFDSTSAKTNYR